VQPDADLGPAAGPSPDGGFGVLLSVPVATPPGEPLE
jgi:hypothetical protein